MPPKTFFLDDVAETLLAGLAHSKMPSRCLPPMLATLGSLPADAERFLYEVKWDGYRALAQFDGRRLILCSRSGLNLLPRFPELAPLRSQLQMPLVLDGELVALDQEGRPSFSALQTRMPKPRGIASGTRRWDPQQHALYYMIFDILHYDGKSTFSLPYVDRRSLLESLGLVGNAWQTPPTHPDGAALLALMQQNHQEGIIAKRRTSIYQPGRRSHDWIKIKITLSDEFVVVGWWSSGKNGLSSLLLGYYANAEHARHGAPLMYCGKVGTGFSRLDRLRIERVLKRLVVSTPPVNGNVPHGSGLSWCRPALVAQVRFSEWTHDGILRHPAFLGLRSDKLPSDVVHEPGE